MVFTTPLGPCVLAFCRNPMSQNGRTCGQSRKQLRSLNITHLIIFPKSHQLWGCPFSRPSLGFSKSHLKRPEMLVTERNNQGWDECRTPWFRIAQCSQLYHWPTSKGPTLGTRCCQDKTPWTQTWPSAWIMQNKNCQFRSKIQLCSKQSKTTCPNLQAHQLKDLEHVTAADYAEQCASCHVKSWYPVPSVFAYCVQRCWESQAMFLHHTIYSKPKSKVFIM